MARYEIAFRDEVEHDNLDDCVESLIDYLQECVQNRDVSAFGIYKLRENDDDELPELCACGGKVDKEIA